MLYIELYTYYDGIPAIAKETKEVVQKEEEEATVKAQTTQEIADSAQRDLDEALPALVSSIVVNIIVHSRSPCCFKFHNNLLKN